MKIYLLRHGESTSDRDDIFGGDYDDHLTELGQKQAHDLAKILANKNIDKLYYSPKIRAIESAEIINKMLKTEIEVMHNLKVRNHYGIMTGLTKQEAQDKYPHLIELLDADTHNTIEGGESYDDFYTRCLAAINEVKENKNHERIAILTHRGFIRALFRDYFKLGEIVIDFAGFVEIESTYGKLKVTHLEKAKLTKPEESE